MKALILAAGKGERLKELTKDRPKGMVSVGGRPLIDHVLDFLDHPKITEVGIVTGYQPEILESHIKAISLSHNPTISLFRNPHFHEGSIRTIMTAQDFLDTDFIVLNADHIYPKRMADVYFSQCKGMTIACDFDRALTGDDMKIKLDSKRHLTKIRKDLKEFDGGYIGSTFVPKNRLGAYKEVLRASYEIYGKQSNAEAAVGHMAANGEVISVADLSNIGWLEVDTQEDLKHAEEVLSKGL